jgi:putative nucleotidyltransferase with HDIG domain
MSEDVDIQKILGKIDKLPTLPFVVTALNDLIRNPQTSAADINKVIMKDPAISSRILKLVNSAFYGFSERISSISHAIVILGFNTVKNVALTASVFDMFAKEDDPSVQFDRKAFWLHALAVAATSRLLATKVRLPAAEDIFVAGLLHDIGKLVLDQYVHDVFVKVLKVTRQKNCLMKDAEAEVLNGINHSQIGAWLGMKWKLPTGLVQMIGFHHRPMPDDALLKPIACIHLADILVRSLDIGFGGDQRIPMLSKEAWGALGLRYEDIDVIMGKMEEELSDAEAFIAEG